MDKGNISRTGKRIRVDGTINVPDGRARRKFKGTTALPNTEGQLQVLTTPNLHPVVITTKPEKVVPTHGKKATRHCERFNGVSVALSLDHRAARWMLKDKHSIPGKRAHAKTEPTIFSVSNISSKDFKRKSVDICYSGANDCIGFLPNSIQQRFQPAISRFTMGVEKNNDVGRCNLGAFETGSDQTCALGKPNYSYNPIWPGITDKFV